MNKEDEREALRAALESADGKAYDLFREAVALAKLTAAARAARSLAIDVGDPAKIEAAREEVATRWRASLAAGEAWTAAEEVARDIAAKLGRLD